jgi:hypothetical protein
MAGKYYLLVLSLSGIFIMHLTISHLTGYVVIQKKTGQNNSLNQPTAANQKLFQVKTEELNFFSLDEIVDGSQNMDGRINYFLNGDTLKMFTRPNSYDRPKVRTKSKIYLDGKYTWRVYVPRMGEGDMASIGCFLYYDDLHELDFEIGYGKEEVRKKVNATGSDLVCYVTSQGNPWHQEIKPIKPDAWYEFSMMLSLKNDQYFIEWYVDHKLFSSRQLNFGREIPFYIFSSVENLTFMGDHIAKQENYALFDFMKFEGMVSHTLD